MLSRENKTKFTFLELLIKIAIAACIVNLPIFYFINQPYTYALVYFLLIYAVLLYIIHKRHLSYELSTRIITLLILVHLLIIPVMNGVDTWALNWFVLYPIVVFSMHLHKKSLFISLFGLVVFFILYIFSFFHSSYGILHIVTISMIYFSLATVLFFINKNLEYKEDSLNQLNENLEKRVTIAINEIHEKEKLILQQSRLAQMGDMINMIAHQWRQPLSAITSSAAALQVQIALNNYSEKNFNNSLENITDYAEKLSKTIDGFRSYFMPNEKRTTFNVEKAIGHALELTGGLLESANIVVVKEFQEVELENYENEIIQVIINIIRNAADALIEIDVENPKIILKLFKNIAFEKVVSIEDNAGGIPETIVEQIFEPYFSTKSKNGKGLGLYMSKFILEDHCNGSLSFHNTEHGACFVITFH